VSRQAACDLGEARARASVARRYLEVAELTASEDDAAAWRNVATGNAVLAGIAASDAVCCAVDLLTGVDQRLARDLDRLLQVKDIAHYGAGLISDAKVRSCLRAAQHLVEAAETAMRT
jgi:hypothetical protein